MHRYLMHMSSEVFCRVHHPLLDWSPVRIVREELASGRGEVTVNSEPPPIDVAKGLTLFNIGHNYEVPALPVSSRRCPKSDLQALLDQLRLHRT